MSEINFIDIIGKLLEGKKLTRKEWNDKRHYVCMKDSLLYIHKAGEKDDLLRPWIISDVDMLAEDWQEL